MTKIKTKQEKIISVLECAEELCISRQRVHALIRQGKIKVQKIGRIFAVTDYSLALLRKNGRPKKII